jgi:hypothetical protein
MRRMTTKERARILRVGEMTQAEYEQELDRLETAAVEAAESYDGGLVGPMVSAAAYSACTRLQLDRMMWEQLRQSRELRPTLTLVAGGRDA